MDEGKRCFFCEEQTAVHDSGGVSYLMNGADTWTEDVLHLYQSDDNVANSHDRLPIPPAVTNVMSDFI